MIYHRNKETGSVLLIVIIMVVVMLSALGVYITAALTQNHAARRAALREQAQVILQAAVSRALHEVNMDNSYFDTNSLGTANSPISLASGCYYATAEDLGAGKDKLIRAYAGVDIQNAGDPYNSARLKVSTVVNAEATSVLVPTPERIAAIEINGDLDKLNTFKIPHINKAGDVDDSDAVVSGFEATGNGNNLLGIAVQACESVFDKFMKAILQAKKNSTAYSDLIVGDPMVQYDLSSGKGASWKDAAKAAKQGETVEKLKGAKADEESKKTDAESKKADKASKKNDTSTVDIADLAANDSVFSAVKLAADQQLAQDMANARNNGDRNAANRNYDTAIQAAIQAALDRAIAQADADIASTSALIAQADATIAQLEANIANGVVGDDAVLDALNAFQISIDRVEEAGLDYDFYSDLVDKMGDHIDELLLNDDGTETTTIIGNGSRKTVADLAGFSQTVEEQNLGALELALEDGDKGNNSDEHMIFQNDSENTIYWGSEDNPATIYVDKKLHLHHGNIEGWGTLIIGNQFHLHKANLTWHGNIIITGGTDTKYYDAKFHQHHGSLTVDGAVVLIGSGKGKAKLHIHNTKHGNPNEIDADEPGTTINGPVLAFSGNEDKADKVDIKIHHAAAQINGLVAAVGEKIKVDLKGKAKNKSKFDKLMTILGGLTIAVPTNADRKTDAKLKIDGHTKIQWHQKNYEDSLNLLAQITGVVLPEDDPDLELYKYDPDIWAPKSQ